MVMFSLGFANYTSCLFMNRPALYDQLARAMPPTLVVLNMFIRFCIFSALFKILYFFVSQPILFQFLRGRNVADSGTTRNAMASYTGNPWFDSGQIKLDAELPTVETIFRKKLRFPVSHFVKLKNFDSQPIFFVVTNDSNKVVKRREV